MSTHDPELHRCPTCGELRGLLHRHGGPPVLLACICQGIPCSRCKTNKIRRPTSNYLRDGEVWHVPWFGYADTCDACRAGRPPS